VLIRILFGPKDPSQADWKEIVRAKARLQIPQNTSSCGEIGLGDSAADAQRCVQSAIDAKRGFSLLAQGLGDDSQIWILSYGGESQQFSSVYFDSYGSQLRGRPSFLFYKEICSKFKFRPESPIDPRENQALIVTWDPT
jgi:hypothetical protein